MGHGTPALAGGGSRQRLASDNERLAPLSTLINVLDVMGGAAVSTLTGYVAREYGGTRGQAVWAAWWLGTVAIPLNLLESASGLRPAVQPTRLAFPPGVSTLVDVADPNTAGMLFAVTT